MKRLGTFLVKRRKSVLVSAVIGLVLAGAYGGSVAGNLSNGGFEDETSQSFAGAELLAERFGVEDPAIVLILGSGSETVDSPAIAAEAAALLSELAAEPGVESVTTYWQLGSPSAMRSDDGTKALAFVTIAGDEGEVLATSTTLIEAYVGTHGGVSLDMAGSGPLFAELQETIESDLARAELLSFPVTLVLLVLVFGSVVAALLPLAVGVFAIVTTLMVLQVLTGFTEVSIFALNLTTGLGLGLAIDYALFVVSRYREELAEGHSVEDSVVRTVQTAGRTVVFSAATVAASLSAMLVFKLSFLKSFGFAGIAVVAMAGIGAVVVLPALLAVLGHRIEKLRIRKPREVVEGEGLWHRIATTVMKRPLPVATAAIALLLFLGAPFLGIELGTTDDRMLGEEAYAREVGDILRDDFASSESSPISVVSADLTEMDALTEYSLELSSLDSVARVDSLSGSFIGGTQVSPPTPLHAQFNGNGTYLSVIPSVDPLSPAAAGLVEDVRSLDAPVDVSVTGQSASFVDTKASLLGSLKWAVLIIALITFVLLFVMFGSVVVPAKAVLLNVLSLSGTFGALVWIFQEGHLSKWLGFTATGTLDLSMPILIFVSAFGLSMDYEVFLLSRIKEEYDKTGDNRQSVATGLEQTGRLVTAAAVLIAVVFAAFATSSVVSIKMFGIGMALAVMVDAFIVRATLVPAFMAMAGNVNWWAPPWMKRLHAKIGVSESVELD